MSKKQYCVRVVCIADPIIPPSVSDYPSEIFIECLRYAGLITPHNSDEFIIVDGIGCAKQVFDIECPHGLDSKVWSEQNAKRMKSFGYNAVSAPSTRTN